ncbi:adenylate/guanylate cyclase domain-containing protein [Candidatus Binatus soli]|jgi:class 3 adenylate cyclase/tetratricopeptide (TPR) repeat protein|uniref:adenylate/guanylate cyclase domain-containing protein n=1 Tax=Candidatus Binatus soli TaxID=1953413 RepID=UPI003D0987E6
MRCAKCGTDNAADARFCNQCATPLSRACPKCARLNAPDAKFCAQCAAPLGGHASLGSDVSASPAPGDGVRVAPEQPEALATDGERKTVTALFADIKGSMDLMEDLDPEEARALIDPALKLMIDAVHRYDGYIVQSTGDGIFALFGAPVAHEDHAQRGLYAALRVQEGMARYSASLRAAGNPPVEIRVGLNTGEVVVRSIRTDDAHTEYTPIGHSMSLAARMQTLAPTGSIVITEQTQKLTAGYFDLKPLGAARIKGVSDPINVYEVIGIGPLRTRLQMSALRGLSKFVGRRAELDQLDKALELARGGHGQIVAAMAEAGVGKSRLFYEFKMRGQSECLVLEAFSFSHGKASAYLPVLDLLKSYFRIVDRDDERTRCEKVTGKVLSLDRALEDTLLHLFAMLGIRSGDARLDEMDPSIRRRRTREAVKSLIVRESMNQPLIVIFEDLHWIDTESEAILNLIADSIGTAQILMMVNYRPEYRHNWGNKTYYTQLRLDPLGPDNAAELLTAMLGEAAALDPLKAAIIQRTEGNPFFIEEMVQVLFDQGALVRDGTVSLAKPLTSIEIPSTVKGILAARIDKLAPADKDLLQSLAVIGKEFPVGLVRRVVGKPDHELAPMLSNLQAAEFIYEQPAFPENEYTFKHALTQEVAYGSVLMERRRILHERTALALEAMFAATLDDHLTDLAHHYGHSANAPKAIEYLSRAAEQAGIRSAYNDAIRYAREALLRIGELPESRERDQRELKIQMMLGPLIVAVQGFSSPEIAGTIARTQELCCRAGETPETFGVLFGVWSFNHASGKLRESRVIAEQLLAMAARMQSDLATAGAHNAMGSTQLWMGEFSAAREHQEMVAKIYNRDIPRYLPSMQAPVIPSRCHLAWALHIGGHPEQARQRMREADDMAAQLRRPFSLAFVHLYAIVLNHFRHEYADVRSRSETLIELSTEYGFPYWLAAGKMCLARTIAGEGYYRGDEAALTTGLTMMKESAEHLAASNADLIYSFSFVLLAELYLMMKRPDECLRELDLAAQRSEQMDHRLLEAEIHRLRGQTMLILPDGAAEAERCFRRAIEIAVRQQARSWELRATTSLAGLLDQQGKRDQARTMLAEISNWFTEGIDTADLKDAKSVLAGLNA